MGGRDIVALEGEGAGFDASDDGVPGHGGGLGGSEGVVLGGGLLDVAPGGYAGAGECIFSVLGQG